MKKVIALLLVLIISVSFIPAASAYDNDTLKQAVQSAAAAVKADDPTLGSEWFLVADSTWQICDVDEAEGDTVRLMFL